MTLMRNYMIIVLISGAHCSLSLTNYNIHYYVLAMSVGGTLWLVLLGLHILITGRKVVKTRAEKVPFHRLSSSLHRGSIASWGNREQNEQMYADIQDDYETIPEEYLETKNHEPNQKVPKFKDSISLTAEYDLANDNHDITRQADQLLRNVQKHRRSQRQT